MQFDFESAVPVLARTPALLDAWLRGLPDAWVIGTEGPDTWSPFDVVGHLIHGERTDWIPRVEHLLAHGEAVPLPAFDRFAQFETSKGKPMSELLDTFATLRSKSLARLSALNVTRSDLDRAGRHAELGRVTLGQLLSTWVVHDLDHIMQIARVMGRQYSDEVGPWRRYLRIISGDQG